MTIKVTCSKNKVALYIMLGVFPLAFSVMAQENQQDQDDINLAQELEGVLTLDEINVSGAVGHSESDKAFSQPGGVVFRGENKQLQSLDSVVRALPGTFTNIDPAQGTVNVNIRGMSGLGRVNTLVDGVPQTFFGTSANGDSRFHSQEGGLPPSNQFGTMIEPNFLVGVGVNKGFNAGAQGINSLAGSSSFKTLGVDDVIRHGKRIGLRSRLSYGSNALGWSRMLAVAGKKQAFTEAGHIGGLVAFSSRDVGSNYRRGDGSYAKSNGYVKRLDQEPQSWLAKFEIAPTPEHDLMVSGRTFENHVGGRVMENKNYQLDYHYTPDVDWLDLEVVLANTQNHQVYDKSSALWQLTDASTDNKSNYLDIKNTSYFNIGLSEVMLTYGLNYFDNEYARQATGVNADNLAYTPFAPSGKQKISSLYLTNSWNYEPFTVDLGLTYSHANFKGYKPACGQVGHFDVPCFPKGEANIDLTDKGVNPSIMLSANLNPWFSPFISYARSSRMPNIQEVFFNNESGGSMNPYLKPEKSKTYQVGFNAFKQSWLIPDDKLGIKLLYFRSAIDHYIYSRSFYISNTGGLTTDVNLVGPAGFHAQIPVNSSKGVNMNGVELELNYDANWFYTRLSYSQEKTAQPIGVQSSTDGFGYGDIYELPNHYATLDVGTRLYQNKLTLGTLFKYTGQAKRLSPKGKDLDTGEVYTQVLPTSPVILDLYATYEAKKNLNFTFSIQNALDKLYIDPLNSQNTTRSQYVLDTKGEDAYTYTNYARGRTFLLGVDYKF